VFTARYALSPCIKQIRFVFKGLICFDLEDSFSNPYISVVRRSSFLQRLRWKWKFPMSWNHGLLMIGILSLDRERWGNKKVYVHRLSHQLSFSSIFLICLTVLKIVHIVEGCSHSLTLGNWRWLWVEGNPVPRNIYAQNEQFYVLISCSYPWKICGRQYPKYLKT
jgi:hypothetical protein